MAVSDERPEEFVRDLLVTLGEIARERSTAAMGSRTLAQSTRVVIERDRFARVIVPHYWSVFHHWGRKGIDLTGKKGFLIYFEDPRNDPRTEGTRNYPVLRSQVKHLTSAQFNAGVKENTRRLRAGIKQPFMIVTKKVGPAEGTFFFTEGLASFPHDVSEIGRERFRQHLLDQIPRNIKDSAALRI